MASNSLQTLHLIYIHGFRGDHTTFQAFPSDLHNHLLPLLPPQFELHSSLYPTYKSVHPISHAARQFLAWLEKQPHGPVILLAHSMGGLLAAEAATDKSPVSQRIVGVVGLDAPLLGMHPHVILSGIASLFPKEQLVKTEKSLNDKNVRIVPEKDAFNQDLSTSHLSVTPTKSNTPSPTVSPSASPTITPTVSPPPSPALMPLDHAVKHLQQKYAANPLFRWLAKHADDPVRAVGKWIVEHFEFGSCMGDPPGLVRRYDALVHWHGHWVNYWTSTVTPPGTPATPELLLPMNPAIPVAVTSPGPSASSGPAYPFCIATQTPANHPSAEEARWWLSALPAEAELFGSLLSQVQGARHSTHAAAGTMPVLLASEAAKARTNGQGDRLPLHAPDARPRHFIVLPYNGGGRRGKWFNVTVAGARDEVAAHCGIFFREQNLAYDAFVDRVSQLIVRWCSSSW